MKNYRLIYSFTIVGLLLSIIACGSSEPIIETAAAELNFAAADLGSAWSLSQELVMNELLTDIPDHALDANQRTFVSEDVAGKVMVSLIYSTNSVSSAEQEMKGDLVEAMANAFEKESSGGIMVEMPAPDIGDEAVMLVGEGSISGVDMTAYVVAIRKTNVFALVFLMGPTDSVSQETAIDFAQKLESRIQ